MDCALVNCSANFPSAILPAVDKHDRKLLVAVLISLLIHGMGLSSLPGIESPLTEVAQRLEIRLPPPVAQSEPKPAPLTPALSPAPRTIRHENDLPVRETRPVITSSAAQVGEDAPAVSPSRPSVASVDETPAPKQPSTALPSKRLDADMLAAFGRELAGAVATHQRYPRIALLRQWQGTVVLQLEFAVDGRLFGVRVLSSSGYEILDRQALEMVRESAPQLPAALAGRPLSVDVPVVFRITS